MALKKFNENLFLSEYIARYGTPGETPQETVNRVISTAMDRTEEDAFREIVKKCLSHPEAVYKHRNYWPETYLMKYFNTLRLSYWPRVA